MISGSWDATIRLWDIRSQTCIFVCRDHNADVYGLAAHEDRPFVYVSCSRDTSIRFWSLEEMFQGVFLKILLEEKKWEEVFEKIDVFPKEGDAMMLCGASSKKLKKELIEMRKDGDLVGAYEKIMKFFKVFICKLFI